MTCTSGSVSRCRAVPSSTSIRYPGRGAVTCSWLSTEPGPLWYVTELDPVTGAQGCHLLKGLAATRPRNSDGEPHLGLYAEGIEPAATSIPWPSAYHAGYGVPAPRRRVAGAPSGSKLG